MENLEGMRISLDSDEIAYTWFFMTGMTDGMISTWMGIELEYILKIKESCMNKVRAANKASFTLWFHLFRSEFHGDDFEKNILKKRYSNRTQE